VNMNSKNSILLVDPDFDVDTSGNFDLLIKVTPDNFSYAIVDELNNRLVALYDQQESVNVASGLSAILSNDKHLAMTFKTVKASVYTPNSIAIPNELFEADNLSIYAKFFAKEQSEQLHLQQLEGQDHTSIFNLNEDLEELLITKFGISKVYDHNAPLMALANNTKGNQFRLDFTVGWVHAVLCTDGKLVFENCFEIADAEEFTYYLLLMIHQLNMDTKDTAVFISGIINQGDDKHLALQQSFSDITYNSRKNVELITTILEDMPEQYYTSVLALQLCG
jgi:hypothetical protein